MSNSTVAKVSSLFNERAEEGRKLAILAGAGISFPAPSNLPFVTPLVTPIVTELIPTLAIADQLLKAENRERRNTKDFLRFETFCEMLVKLKFDPKLELLEPLGACRAVNRNHLLLAALIEQGHSVFTTNFDSLIELACNRLGFQPDVLAYADDYSRFLKRASKTSPFKLPRFLQRRSERPLFKLHGSLEVRGRPTRDSVQACLYEIARAAGDEDHVLLEKPKRQVLAKILRDNDLLVLGYSGVDDLDIVPALASIEALGMKVIWVNHTKKPSSHLLQVGPEIEDKALRDDNGHHLAERTRLLSGLVQNRMRHADDVILADADTDSVMEALAAAHGLTLSNSTDPDFKFDAASFAEDWLKAHLPRRSQRCYMGAVILRERERYGEALALFGECKRSAVLGTKEYLAALGGEVNMLLRLERFDEAEKELSTTESQVRSLGDSEILSSWLHQAGSVQYNLGQRAYDRRDRDEAEKRYSTALPIYEEGLRLARQQRYPEQVAATLHQLGLLHMNSQYLRTPREILGFNPPTDLQKAKERFREAAQIARKEGLWERYCQSAFMLAGLLHFEEDYRGEVAALAQVIELSRPLGLNYHLAASYGQLGRAFLRLADFEGSCAALVLAQQYAPGTTFATEIDQTLKELGEKMESTLNEARGKSQEELLKDLKKAIHPALQR